MGASGNDLTAIVTAFILICVIASGVRYSCLCCSRFQPILPTAS